MPLSLRPWGFGSKNIHACVPLTTLAKWTHIYLTGVQGFGSTFMYCGSWFGSYIFQKVWIRIWIRNQFQTCILKADPDLAIHLMRIRNRNPVNHNLVCMNDFIHIWTHTILPLKATPRLQPAFIVPHDTVHFSKYEPSLHDTLYKIKDSPAIGMT